MSRQYERYNTLDENDDINNLLDILNPIQAIWKTFGLKLGVPMSQLEIIQSNVGPEDRLLEVLIRWIRKDNPRPTWPAVVDALLSVDRGIIARRVNREYCPDYKPQQPKRIWVVSLCSAITR